MEKRTLWLVGGATLVIIAALIAWGVFEQKKAMQEKAATPPDANLIYYYGAECPHCHAINEFIDQNDIASKVEFTKKEVWHDKANSEEMAERAKACGIDPNNIGVPFIYDQEKNTCTMGEPDVRKLFSDRAGLGGASDTPAEAPAE